MVKDNKQECNAYFKGEDGLGTCDTECQWYNKDCPVSKKNKQEVI